MLNKTRKMTENQASFNHKLKQDYHMSFFNSNQCIKQSRIQFSLQNQDSSDQVMHNIQQKVFPITLPQMMHNKTDQLIDFGSLYQEKDQRDMYKNIPYSYINEHKRRPSNSVPSNVLRLLIQCVKDLLITEKQIYNKIMSFISSQCIKSQIWGVDAILLFVLFLRDSEKLLAQKSYTGILQLFLSRLKIREQKYNEELSKQKIRNYKIHCEAYGDSNFSYWNQETLQKNRKKLFEKLVKKKKVEVQRAMNKLTSIRKSLQL